MSLSHCLATSIRYSSNSLADLYTWKQKFQLMAFLGISADFHHTFLVGQWDVTLAQMFDAYHPDMGRFTA